MVAQIEKLHRHGGAAGVKLQQRPHAQPLADGVHVGVLLGGVGNEHAPPPRQSNQNVVDHRAQNRAVSDDAFPRVAVGRLVGDEIGFDQHPVPGPHNAAQGVPGGSAEARGVQAQQSQAVAHGGVGGVVRAVGAGKGVFGQGPRGVVGRGPVRRLEPPRSSTPHDEDRRPWDA